MILIFIELCLITYSIYINMFISAITYFIYVYISHIHIMSYFIFYITRISWLYVLPSIYITSCIYRVCVFRHAPATQGGTCPALGRWSDYNTETRTRTSVHGCRPDPQSCCSRILACARSARVMSVFIFFLFFFSLAECFAQLMVLEPHFFELNPWNVGQFVRRQQI